MKLQVYSNFARAAIVAGAFIAASAGLSACAGPRMMPVEPPLVHVTPPAPPSVERPGFAQVGFASWYGAAFHRKPTASGEPFDMNDLTAAHRSLPLETVVRVTNLNNGRSVVLRINDRGPYVRGRVIDVSRRAARLLDMKEEGVVPVLVETVGSDGYQSVAASDRPDSYHWGERP